MNERFKQRGMVRTETDQKPTVTWVVPAPFRASLRGPGGDVDSLDESVSDPCIDKDVEQDV